jgi:hypothetical protein
MFGLGFIGEFETKSTVHYSGLDESDITTFKNILPYNFSDLSVGFKYLGYYLKAGLQKANDWSGF